MSETNADVRQVNPIETTTLYMPEMAHEKIILSEPQKEAVRSITMSIEEVNEEVRSMAIPDIINTLESGHPLNRLITDTDGEVTGYIACEDFVPQEAYIKYLGTTKQTGRNLLREIPDFIEYAQKQGYKKLSFHGWNGRLNHILERYGFEQVRSDEMMDTQVGFYEKTLVEQPSKHKDRKSNLKDMVKHLFDNQGHLEKVKLEYQKTLDTISPDVRQTKEQLITSAFQALSQKLVSQEKIEFGEHQQAILKLKLARHFQKVEEGAAVDVNTFYDAILESPKFINTDKGSLDHLLEVHQVKTLQKIAEARRRRSEMGDKTGNPYENLFATSSGKYYVARLLNMPHLEAESDYMRHCVGTSDSYINQMKRGDIEILSFRNMPEINKRTQKLEGDTPIITIEYNLKTKTIEQMKKQGDEYLSTSDPYYQDVIDALKQLRTTTTDIGSLRDFSKIASSELEEIQVKDYYVLTENGEVSFRDVDLDAGTFILKAGKMPITLDTPREDIAKIVQLIEGIKCRPDEIAQTQDQVTNETKAYIGKPFSNFFNWLPDHIEHVYASFPEGKIRRETVEVTGKTGREYEEMLKQKGIQSSNYANQLLKSPEFTTIQSPEQIDLISLKVGDLGFTSYPTTTELYQKASELGLELCPPAVAPEYLMQNPNLGLYEWRYVAMEQITDSDGSPRVFRLERDGGGLELSMDWAVPTNEWDLDRRLVFRHRKLNS